MADEKPDRFESAPGFAGRVYVPPCAGPRKHDCPDCCFCQWCSDDRCAACLAAKTKRRATDED